MLLNNLLNGLKAVYADTDRGNSGFTAKTRSGADVTISTMATSSSYNYLKLFTPSTCYTSFSDVWAVRPTLYATSNGTEVFYGIWSHNGSSYTICTGVVFGDGNTPPAVTDYWLSGNMFTTFTASTAILTTIDITKDVATGVYTLFNTSDTDFTIREMGLTMPSTQNRTTAEFVLLTREVLDTPIVVPAQDYAVVTYQLRVY